MGTLSVPASISCARRCRFSWLGTAPTLWRSDPSPAAESVEALRSVGDEVEEGLDAFRVALVHERGDVGVARRDLADAELFQIFLVFGQGGGDNRRAGVSR